ncbi:CoA-binding protein [Oceanispirochaeta crateris]|jgi:predicted CoA-binding protein|uniref:CoA-binding protein n=1 Tax=Oceanispirochaeta crateris TaxID=2518645 RepID=A0A5C1QM99_9SPIO|nr:CoA-binding protein [Oceanispirochaeta crateris]QEN07282.1 CoA-binding protein [Oceanispirochaeta crateris]
MKENVAILGASQKAERYSYKALQMLLEYGHNVFPVHPVLQEIEGHKVYPSLSSIDEKIDTLTVYVSPKWLTPDMISEILALNPGRVIMNPGTESSSLKEALDQAGISWLEACTLVLLRTKQFS